MHIKNRKIAAGKSTATRDDVGADSRDERARLQMRVQELEHQKRQLEIKVIGRQGEIDDLKREKACLQQAAVQQRAREPKP